MRLRNKLVRYSKYLSVSLGLSIVTSASAVDFSNPNTSFFSISDFLYPEQLNIKSFNVSGFYTPKVGNNKAQISVLPHVSLNVSAAKFLDDDGFNVDVSEIDKKTRLSEIIIPIRYVRTLPNDIEGTAIASQVMSGTKLEQYLPEPVLQGPGLPALDNYGSNFPDVRMAVMSSTQQYMNLLQSQNQAKQKWQSIKARLAEMDSLEIKLKISGETVAARKLSGSTIIAGNTLPPLTLIEPSLRTVNKIRQGFYDVEIGFTFRDTNTGSINVTQDYAMVMNNYINETRRVITKSKSSGWSIFNIGSRRLSTSQKINESARYNSHYDQTTNTNIVIEDADTSLISYFEDQFFPTLSKIDTISSHLEAAQLASNSNNQKLEKAHRDYAKALQTNNESSELDAIGAAAALSSGNYAMFLAKGVRFKKTSGSQVSSFSRVISQNVSEGISKDWTAVKKRSAYRKITIALLPETNDKGYKSYEGTCGMNTYNSIYLSMPHSYFIPTCIKEGSPLHAAGILPGTFVVSVDSEQITSPQQYINIIKTHDPGDVIYYRVLKMTNVGPQTATKRVVLGKGGKL